jgi:serine protease SohB
MKAYIPFLNSDPVVPVIRLSGVIAAANRAGALNDATLAPVIEKAFGRGKPVAVALAINSPGGSPVQSSLVAARIRRLADEKNIPVHAFVEDVAASGGYWLACAADHIWIDDSSIVGSIGVISASFGFHKVMKQLGIDRRVYTAGKDKSVLDPFRAERPDDVERLKDLQTQIHAAFIDHVKSRRGARLDADEDLFTGAFWLGRKAVSLGLADGIAHLVPKMKELYGEKTRFVPLGPKRGVLQRFGASLASSALASVNDQAHWGRFGL